MAWSWGHTREAYENARENLSDLPEAEIAILWAEWRTYHFHGGDHAFGQVVYGNYLIGARRKLAKGFREYMEDQIWDWMDDYATCTNGGGELYGCPYGCGPHLISVDRHTKTEDRDNV